MKNRILPVALAILATGLLNTGSVRAANLTLNFSSAGGTILDTNGIGTGFTARMAGSGDAITNNDPNVLLNTGAGVLRMLTSPGADINGQAGMSNATIVGVNLSSLGFSGNNDFSVTASFINLTNLYLFPDQLCLVVGSSTSNMIRAGFINFSQFHSNNPATANEGFGTDTIDGADLSQRFFGASVGSSMTVTIGRMSGNWTCTVNGVDRMPNSSADGTGTPAPPTFLDAETDLFVGVVALDVFNDSPWFVNLDTFTVHVSGNQPPSIDSQPQKEIDNEGNPVTFSVTPNDSTAAPISYQWRRNGVPIQDQTNSIMTLYPAVADAGLFTVVITNSLGSITSSPAPLYVVAPKGTFSVNFNAADGGIMDSNGVGTGFPSRMIGTGASLPANDTNLFLNTGAGTLEITTTSSDYNGANGMDVNETLGVQLSTLGFTGSEDLNATALFPQPFPDTASFDQFGVVVGVDTNAHTRAGCITFAGKERYSENVQTNGAGLPVNGGGQYFGFGFDSTIPMTVLITRTNGIWHYYIDGVNWDVFVQPTFLNSATSLFAGAFAEDVVNGLHKTVSLDSFTARVFDPPSLKVAATGGNLTFTWNVVGPVTLQSNTNLLNPNGWVAVPGVTSSPYVIPTPTTGQKYYRLAF